ncbi:hypothetical protein GmHk_18G052467 [Glycine max]|nr:hypothetical protein GmHk_18G052467 [Glycine max]
MSGSAPSPSRLSTLNEELKMVLVTLPKLTNEEHEQCCEMAKIMLKVAVPPNTILNTINAKDQIYGEVSLSFTVRWKDNGNFHTVVYNQDLDKLAIVAGWTTLRDFYHLTGDHQVSLTHYVAYQNHTQDDTHYVIKFQILSLSRQKLDSFAFGGHCRMSACVQSLEKET